MLLKFTSESGEKVAFHCSSVHFAVEHELRDGTMGTQIIDVSHKVVITESLDTVINTVNAVEGQQTPVNPPTTSTRT